MNHFDSDLKVINKYTQVCVAIFSNTVSDINVQLCNCT